MAKKEMITAMGAAQRLQVSVAEVEALWKEGELKGKKEFSQLYIEKESLYAYSGLSEGRQSKKSAGRKPNVMTFEDAAAFLSTDMAGIKQLVEEGELEVVEGVGGVRGPREAMVKMYKKKLEGRESEKREERSVKRKSEKGEESTPFDAKKLAGKLFGEREVSGCESCKMVYNTHELKEVAGLAYKLGKLAVYESLHRFEREAV